MGRKFSIAEWVAAIAFVGGIVVWGVRLEGRINTQDVTIADLKEQQKAAIDQVREDLAYIRQRIDAATATK